MISYLSVILVTESKDEVMSKMSEKNEVEIDNQSENPSNFDQ